MLVEAMVRAVNVPFADETLQVSFACAFGARGIMPDNVQVRRYMSPKTQSNVLKKVLVKMLNILLKSLTNVSFASLEILLRMYAKTTDNISKDFEICSYLNLKFRSYSNSKFQVMCRYNSSCGC